MIKERYEPILSFGFCSKLEIFGEAICGHQKKLKLRTGNQYHPGTSIFFCETVCNGAVALRFWEFFVEPNSCVPLSPGVPYMFQFKPFDELSKWVDNNSFY